MAATALVAARVEPELKEGARAVLEREGLTESQLIRRVYEYVVSMDEVPQFVLADQFGIELDTGRRDKFQRLLSWMRDDPFAAYDFSSISDEAIEADRAASADESQGWRSAR